MAAANQFGAFVRCRFKRIGCVRGIKVKSCLYEIIWKKYCREGQDTDNNMANAHLMPGT